ncbi:MAG: PD-(D/E)XK nuclease family protein [Archaeoglobaceae archaeon]
MHSSLMEELETILSDQKRLEELLILEKETRGFSREKLIFIGMANVANYYWCAIKSNIKSKKNELQFFQSYLADRLAYSLKLGYIDELPRSNEKLLEIGDQISLGDVEKLLKEKEKNVDGLSKENGEIASPANVGLEINGEKVAVIDPNTSKEERSHLEELYKSNGYRIVDLEEEPMLRGYLHEETKGEKYPSIRWNFNWSDYVIVGIPDGITDSFVYEFKTTRSKFLFYYLKPVALTQADIYGYFFERDNKRVQLYLVNEEEVKTFEDKTDKTKAIDTLRKFKELDNGSTPFRPKEWKCKSCEFKEECKLF